MSKQSKAETGPAAAEAIPDCPHCHKPLPLCICDSITPIESRVSLLILQHPQEQDRALGTARLTALHFTNAVLKIGLSWPSLSKALGRPVHDPSRWAVLYLGSAKVADLETDRDIVAINRKGEIEDNQRAILKDIEGIVLLDGTWSQAKALWWRNAWMLKCQRVILGPAQPVALWQVAPRAAPRRPVHHRGGGDAAWPASKSGPTSPRRCTAVLSGCWPNTARRKACCRSLRRSRNRSETIAAASAPDRAFTVSATIAAQRRHRSTCWS